jgi:hypothetical protein
MKKDIIKEYIYVSIISILPILVIYIPFILKFDNLLFLDMNGGGMHTILKNWDGPHYMIIAKTAYDPELVAKLIFTLVPANYHAAHLPLLPIFIFIFSPIFGILYSGLFATILFGVLLNVIFYTIAKKYTKQPLLLTFVFTVFPPRFLIVRSIVAPETMLVLFSFVSLVMWEKKKYFWSGLSGFFAMLSKIQAAWLFPAYVVASLEEWWSTKKFKWGYLWALLIPLAFLLLSIFYYYQIGDFFAFLNAQSSVSMKLYFPFAQFNMDNPWSKTVWLEDVVFYFMAMFFLAYSMYKDRHRSWFYFSLLYSLFLVFIPQRDMARFVVPLLPIFMLKFERFFTSKKFVVALCFVLPAVYFYVVNFLLGNIAPVADWGPFLE